MRITLRGWGRNQGEKELMTAQLEDEPVREEIDGYSMDETYLEVHPAPRVSGGHMFQVSLATGAKLNLNGSYLVRLELSRKDIARLFFLTHGGDIVRWFASFVQAEEEQVASKRLARLAEIVWREKHSAEEEGPRSTGP
jgi:hypothetical protein